LAGGAIGASTGVSQGLKDDGSAGDILKSGAAGAVTGAIGGGLIGGTTGAVSGWNKGIGSKESKLRRRFDNT
jgi:hypothetical protein